MVTRVRFIEEARKWIGTRFSHQGRNRRNGLDCGGLILVVGRALALTDLEELGYSSFPTGGRFEALLNEHADALGITSKYPHKFTGDEFLPGDLLGFDYQNGEGLRHVALVTRWDGACYWIIDAQPDFGVTEHPLRHPFSKATLSGFRVRGLK